MEIIALLLGLAIALLIGVPVVFALAVAAVLGFLILGEVDPIIIPQRMFNQLDSFTLLAIPFYILVGELMSRGGITNRLVDLANLLVGRFRGGFAQVNGLTSLLFAGISGSAQADAAAVGSLMIPTMLRQGYHKDFTVALTASTSIVGPLIPPSVLMIIYGGITGLSVGQLFLAGILPGLLVVTTMAIVTYVYARKRNYVQPAPEVEVPIREILIRAIPALFIPIIIVAGILGGIFTATEAGIIAAVYSLLLALVTRSLRLRDLPSVFSRAAITSSIVMLLIGFAAPVGWLVVRQGVAEALGDALTSFTTNPEIMIVLMVLVVLAVGLFIETITATVVLVPIFTPIAQLMGYDPVHFATVMVYALLIGAVTPPVGTVFFISSSIAQSTMRETFKTMWVFVAFLIASLVMVMYIPALTTWLPSLGG